MPLIVHSITQLCAALQYAHEQQIVHGNIQLSSILMQNDQHILLTNFSMKSIYQEGKPLVAQIEEGNQAYIAPEQVVGMLSPASDIYAVGILLYRLLTGHLPYDGESAGEIALKHVNEAIPSLRTLRPDLRQSSLSYVWLSLKALKHASQTQMLWQKRCWQPLPRIVHLSFLSNLNAALRYVLDKERLLRGVVPFLCSQSHWFYSD
jgi:serine/threonine protein kinase